MQSFDDLNSAKTEYCFFLIMDLLEDKGYEQDFFNSQTCGNLKSFFQTLSSILIRICTTYTE